MELKHDNSNGEIVLARLKLNLVKHFFFEIAFKNDYPISYFCLLVTQDSVHSFLLTNPKRMNQIIPSRKEFFL